MEYCVFINNTALMNGGSISNQISTFKINHNCFIDVSSVENNGIYSQTKPNVEYNWWGSNEGPLESSFANNSWIPTVWYVYDIKEILYTNTDYGFYLSIIEGYFQEYNNNDGTYHDITDSNMVINRPVSNLMVDVGEITFPISSLDDIYWHGNDKCYNVSVKIDSTTVSKVINHTNDDNIPFIYNFRVLKGLIQVNDDNLTLFNNYSFDNKWDTKLKSGIPINKRYSIDGNGFCIDGEGCARIFNVAGDNVNLCNISIYNGNASDGGALYWSGNNGAIYNLKFTNNTANNGGAIYVIGNLNITESNFNNNTQSIHYGASAGGQINSSTFASNSGDVRNIYIENSSHVRVYDNTLDALSNLNVSNNLYDQDINITCDFDSGVNFNMTKLKININNTMIDNVILDINHFKFGLGGGILDVGQYILSAFDDTNNNLAFTDDSSTFTINPLPYDIVIYLVTLGENTTVNVIIPKDVTGAVSVNVNGSDYPATKIADGVYQVNITDLGAGNYTVNATLSSDPKYADKTSENQEFEVAKNELSDDEFKVDVTQGKVGENTTVTVTAPKDTTGDIIVNVDGTEYPLTRIADGVYQVNITDLEAGNYTVNATLSDDPNYNDKVSENQEFEVAKISDYVDKVNVTVTPADDKSNTTVKVIVPEDFDGNVTVSIDGKENKTIAPNDKGEYILDVPLSAGKHNVVAILQNSSKYGDLTTAPENFTVKSTDYTEDVTVQSNDTSSTISVALPDDASGNVTVIINGKTYNATVTNGTATINGPALNGNNNITVVYSGDDKYAGSSTVKKYEVILDAEDMKRGWVSPYDYLVKLHDGEGNPIANKTVTFTVDSKQYSATTDADGIAKLTTSKLAVGTYTVTVTNPMNGEESTAKITIVKRLIENKDIVMDYNDGHKYTVRAIGDDGNPVGEGVVDITVNGVTYKVKADKKGYASLAINLIPKTFTIKAKYHDVTVKNKLTVKQILKVKKTVKVKKTAKKLVLKATLKSSNGKAIKGKVIKFKFKGKTYNAKTNSKGIAKVTIKKVIKKLKKGKKYNYKATYIDDSVKGKVKVK